MAQLTSATQTFKQLFNSVNESSTEASVAAAAKKIAEKLRVKFHAGCFDSLHPLFERELSVVSSSLNCLDDAIGDGGLYDDYNELIERLMDWAESKRVALI